ncbi:hypothetical protein ACFL6U_29140 [Planctomycetota bacterium]
MNAPDSIHVLGIQYGAEAVDAVDEQGRMHQLAPLRPMRDYQYKRPLYSHATGEPGACIHSFNLTFDQDFDYPVHIATLDLPIKVLVTKRFEEVMIPFEVSETWVELGSALKVRLDETVADGQIYSYRLAIEYSGAVHPFIKGLGSIALPDGLPPAFVTDYQAVDDQGDVIEEVWVAQHMTWQRPPSGSDGDETISISGNCTTDSDRIANLRFIVAHDLVVESLLLQLVHRQH